MPSTLSPSAERVVQDMVRVAGGEPEFAAALSDLRKALGPSISAAQILDYLLTKRIQQLQNEANANATAAR